MALAARACAVAVFLLAAALPAYTQEPAHLPHAPDAPAHVPHAPDAAARVCLNQKERRVLVESGAVLHLAAALRAVRTRVPGTLVRARLCRRQDGYAYVLTVLGHDGKVTRVVVDAVKGTLVGER